MITEAMITEFVSSPNFMLYMIPFMIWDMIWRGIALWKSGRNNQLAWFVALLLVNSIGILPIIYIMFFQKPNAEIEKKTETKVRKKK